MATTTTEPLCLDHFLTTIHTPQNHQIMDNDCVSKATSSPAVPAPTRRQPSRKAKKATNFLELENPGCRKRSRDESDETELEYRRPKKMPMKRRRALGALNYDVDLDEVPVRDREYEITWAANMLKNNTKSTCCFPDQVVICRQCELKRHSYISSGDDDATSPPPKKRIKLVGRLAEQHKSDPEAAPKVLKRRVKIVGRLAEQAEMQTKKVSLSEPLRWNTKDCAKPFMMIRHRGRYFAVDYCKDLIVVPLDTVLPSENLHRLLFGGRKNYVSSPR